MSQFSQRSRASQRSQASQMSFEFNRFHVSQAPQKSQRSLEYNRSQVSLEGNMYRSQASQMSLESLIGFRRLRSLKGLWRVTGLRRLPGGTTFVNPNTTLYEDEAITHKKCTINAIQCTLNRKSLTCFVRTKPRGCVVITKPLASQRSLRARKASWLYCMTLC